MSDLIECRFEGGSFVPSTTFQRKLATERFGDGEVILVATEHERSMRSHRHYFAMLHDLWVNLPERYATEQWAQSIEHLRKYALIRCGYSETTTFVCSSAAEAARWAANMRPIDEFSIVLAKGATVVRYAAQSQATKVMGSKVFAKSKEDVLGFVEELVRDAAPENAA